MNAPSSSSKANMRASQEKDECKCNPCECILPPSPGTPTYNFTKTECDCSPCECTLPPAVTATFTKDECTCNPCECSLSPSPSPTSLSPVSKLDCSCSPCQCSLPTTLSPTRNITHLECTCSPCECSEPPSNISSDPGIVRAPSPLPTTGAKIVPVAYNNNEFFFPPPIPTAPVLRMQSAQVSAKPTLQNDQVQTLTYATPYGLQAAAQFSPLGYGAPSPAFYGQAQAALGLPPYYQGGGGQAFPYTGNPPTQQTMGMQDSQAMQQQQATAHPTPQINPAAYGILSQGVYSQYPGVYGFTNQAFQNPQQSFLRNLFMNATQQANGGPLGTFQQGQYGFVYGSEDSNGNQRTRRMSRDSCEQASNVKDFSGLCCPPKRRKVSKSSPAGSDGSCTNPAGVVLVREVYRFQNVSRSCLSKKRISPAASSICCRPPWSNAYKYRSKCCISRVRPPRPPTYAPCPLCKGCECICGGAEQTKVCSQKSSRQSCGNNANNAEMAVTNGRVNEAPNSGPNSGRACDIFQLPMGGPVSLVREFFVHGNRLPLPISQQCYPQGRVRSSVSKPKNTAGPEERQGSERTGMTNGNSATEGKKSLLMTVSKVPLAPIDDQKSSNSLRRSSVERRKSTVQRKQSESNGNKENKDSARQATDQEELERTGSSARAQQEQRKSKADVMEGGKQNMEAKDDDNGRDNEAYDNGNKGEEKPNERRRRAPKKSGGGGYISNAVHEKRDSTGSTESIGWRTGDLEDFTATEEEEEEEAERAPEFTSVKSQFFEKYQQ